MAKKTIDQLFGDFCTEHNIYAVASFTRGVTIETVGDTAANNALAGNTQQARTVVLDALADGCEQQSMRLDEFENDLEDELNMHISERAWFCQ